MILSKNSIDRRGRCWIDEFESLTGFRDVRNDMNMAMDNVQWQRRLPCGDFQDGGPTIRTSYCTEKYRHTSVVRLQRGMKLHGKINFRPWKMQDSTTCPRADIK